MADKTLARIAALLRQAEGTDNEHEQQAFMAAAQRIATLESIDLAMARAHTATRERRVTPEQRTVSIGEAGKRGLATYVQLFVAIAAANDVTVDVARNSTTVYGYGFPDDLDVVQALYSSLVVQMVGASEAFLRSGGHHADTRRVRDRATGRWVDKPVHATTARINFQSAFAVRVGERLTQARARARSEAIERHRSAAATATTPAAGLPGDGLSGAGAWDGGSAAAASRGSQGGAMPGSTRSGMELALRAKELEITDYYRSTSTARGSWRAGRARYSRVSQQAGRRAGERAQLGERTAIGGARPAVGPG